MTIDGHLNVGGESGVVMPLTQPAFGVADDLATTNITVITELRRVEPQPARVLHGNADQDLPVVQLPIHRLMPVTTVLRATHVGTVPVAEVQPRNRTGKRDPDLELVLALNRVGGTALATVLVDLTVAVVVLTVTELGCAGVNRRILVVTVDLDGHAGPVAVTVVVDDGFATRTAVLVAAAGTAVIDMTTAAGVFVFTVGDARDRSIFHTRNQTKRQNQTQRQNSHRDSPYSSGLNKCRNGEF